MKSVQITDKLIMFIIIVSDMPKAKTFYADKLGLKITKDYRQDDNHWWVSLSLPEGGVTITLTTFGEHTNTSKMTMYFATSDLSAAHKELSSRGAKVNEVKDDLYGPGSGVKWFNLDDPDGNVIYLVQS